MYSAIPTLYTRSSILGMGYGSNWDTAFRYLKSIQYLSEPSFLGTKRTGLHHSLLDTSIIPSSNIIDFFHTGTNYSGISAPLEHPSWAESCAGQGWWNQVSLWRALGPEELQHLPSVRLTDETDVLGWTLLCLQERTSLTPPHPELHEHCCTLAPGEPGTLSASLHEMSRISWLSRAKKFICDLVQKPSL